MIKIIVTAKARRLIELYIIDSMTKPPNASNKTSEHKRITEL